jgi:hypothetical protein
MFLQKLPALFLSGKAKKQSVKQAGFYMLLQA